MKWCTIALILFYCTTVYYYKVFNVNAQKNEDVMFCVADHLDFRDGYQVLNEDTSPLFYIDNASPGDFLTKYIKIQNKSKQHIDYIIRFEVNEMSEFKDMMTIHIEKINGEIESIPASTLDAKIITGINLGREEYDIYKVSIVINAHAGNEYNRIDSDERLRFRFTMKFESKPSIHEHQFIPLDEHYFGSVHERNWVKVTGSGTAEMKFPKIDSGNGWSINNGKLNYQGIDLTGDSVIYAPIGIKTESLLAQYPGYHVTSVTVNDVEQIENRWIESTDEWDLKKQFTHHLYLKIGEQNQNNEYQIQRLTHDIKITLTNGETYLSLTLIVNVSEHKLK